MKELYERLREIERELEALRSTVNEAIVLTLEKIAEESSPNC